MIPDPRYLQPIRPVLFVLAAGMVTALWHAVAAASPWAEAAEAQGARTNVA
ncbi:MAG: hypothetical protein ABIP94_10715 [Planctomycetota bacterium]